MKYLFSGSYSSHQNGQIDQFTDQRSQLLQNGNGTMSINVPESGDNNEEPEEIPCEVCILF